MATLTTHRFTVIDLKNLDELFDLHVLPQITYKVLGLKLSLHVGDDSRVSVQIRATDVQDQIRRMLHQEMEMEMERFGFSDRPFMKSSLAVKQPNGTCINIKYTLGK